MASTFLLAILALTAHFNASAEPLKFLPPQPTLSSASDVNSTDLTEVTDEKPVTTEAVAEERTDQVPIPIAPEKELVVDPKYGPCLTIPLVERESTIGKYASETIGPATGYRYTSVTDDVLEVLDFSVALPVHHEQPFRIDVDVMGSANLCSGVLKAELAFPPEIGGVFLFRQVLRLRSGATIVEERLLLVNANTMGVEPGCDDGGASEGVRETSFPAIYHLILRQVAKDPKEPYLNFKQMISLAEAIELPRTESSSLIYQPVQQANHYVAQAYEKLKHPINLAFYGHGYDDRFSLDLKTTEKRTLTADPTDGMDRFAIYEREVADQIRTTSIVGKVKRVDFYSCCVGRGKYLQRSPNLLDQLKSTLGNKDVSPQVCGMVYKGYDIFDQKRGNYFATVKGEPWACTE